MFEIETIKRAIDILAGFDPEGAIERQTAAMEPVLGVIVPQLTTALADVAAAVEAAGDDEVARGPLDRLHKDLKKSRDETATRLANAIKHNQNLRRYMPPADAATKRAREAGISVHPALAVLTAARDAMATPL